MSTRVSRQAVYEFRRDDYEKELARLMTANDKSGLIVNNPQQSMFLFVNRRTLKVRGRPPSDPDNESSDFLSL